MAKELSNQIVAIDIGSKMVKSIIGEIDPDGMINIIGIGKSESGSGMKKGNIVSISHAVESIRESINAATNMATTDASEVIISISGDHIKTLNSKAVVAVNGEEIKQYDIDKVLQKSKDSFISQNKEIIHIIPQEYCVDEQTVKNPVNMTGSSLEAKVHVALANSSNAKNLVSCLNKNDLEVIDIVFAPIASSYGVLSENDKELGIIVIDIGHGTATATAYLNGSIVFSTILPVGGYNITNDLAITLNIDSQTAEKIKLKYGFVEVTEDDKENFLELEKYDDIDMFTVSNIIADRVVEIFELLKKELEESGVYDKIHSGVILTGGSANLNGIQVLANEVFDKNIKIGFPHYNIRGLTDLIKHPEYSTLVGLLHFAKEYHYLNVQKSKKRRKTGDGSSWFGKIKDAITKRL